LPTYNFTLTVSCTDIDVVLNQNDLKKHIPEMKGFCDIGGKMFEIDFLVNKASSGLDALHKISKKLAKMNVQVKCINEDLVSISGIIERTKKDEKLIQELVDGDGKFPTPVDILSSGVQIWRWCDVQQFFQVLENESYGYISIGAQDAAVFTKENEVNAIQPSAD
jgi:hypothetical protein